MKKYFKCILSIVLALVMVLDLLPVGPDLMPEPVTVFGFQEGDDESGTIGEFDCVVTITDLNYEDGELTEIGVNFTADCPNCGNTFEEDFYLHDPSEVSPAGSDCQALVEQWSADCGHHCIECVEEEHCHFCGGCLDDGVMPCGDCFSKRCLSCHDDDCWCDVCEACICDDDGDPVGEEMHMADGETIYACPDCADDSLLCENCDQYIYVGNYCPDSFYCESCALCSQCMEDEQILIDYGHCKQCTICGSDEYVCDECHLCSDEALGNTHCPLCEQCFGEDEEVIWCDDGGDHCTDCCYENDWICTQCGSCMEALGEELCADCGLCPDCCLENSEAADCIHGYCVESSEFEDHACPGCGMCTQDEECDHCGLCPECQLDYHCEHEICPDDSIEWDAHLCEGCGDCFDPDDLCEWCGLCEFCNEHCEHGICPEDPEYSDHICPECGLCSENLSFCEFCHKCTNCCSTQTLLKGCKHGICIESPEFQTHYCFIHRQCLEKCNHSGESGESDCEHANISDEWSCDDGSHWHICEDCGIALDCEAHTVGEPVVVKEPNAETRTPGIGQRLCTVCGQLIDTVTIPYYVVEEDSAPGILVQPSGATKKPSDLDLHHKPQYVTFSVYASGSDLQYQWYCRAERYKSDETVALTDERGDERAYNVSGKDAVSGANTNKLTVLVDPLVCVTSYTYWCVITNSAGSAETIHVPLHAQHVYTRFEDNRDGETHRQICVGITCGRVKDEKDRKLPHRYGEWDVIQPATETKDGSMERACLDCGAKQTQSIPMVEQGHTHIYDQWVYNDEYHWHRCKCGVTERTISRRGQTLISVIKREAHTFGAETVVREATDKHTGRTEQTCTVCGYVKTGEIPKLPHTHDFQTLRKKDIDRYMVPNGYIEPDCHAVFCEGCTQVKKEPHTYGMYSVSRILDYDSKGNEIPGLLRHTCMQCGHIEFVEYHKGWPIILDIALDGDVSAVNSCAVIEGPATASPGEKVTLKAVMNEGYLVDKFTNSEGSTYGGWDFGEVTPYDTFRMDYDWYEPYGNSKMDWTKFSYHPDDNTITFTMPDGPLAILLWTETCKHKSTQYRDRIEPTCTGYGAQVWRCEDCHAVMSVSDRTEPIGHDFQYDPKGEYIWGDCTHYSTYGVKCTRCGTTMRRNDELAHRWEDLGNESPALCFQNGHEADEVCSECGEVRPGKRIDMIGHHEWDNDEVIREPSPTQKGLYEHTCALCGKKETYQTDYSGPDYRLKADKAFISFDFVYGTEPEPVTVTFQSVGRDPVTKLTSVDFTQIGGLYDAEITGDMQVQIKPVMHTIVAEDDKEDVLQVITAEESGEERPVSPEIHVVSNVKKSQQTYKLTVENGTANDLDDINYHSDMHRSSSITLKAGTMFKLEPDQKEGFVRYEVVQDESGLIAKQMATGAPSYPYYHMPQNDVVLRAVNDNYTVTGLRSSQIVDEDYSDVTKFESGKTYYLMSKCSNIPAGKYVSGYTSEQVKMLPSDKLVTLASFVMPNTDVVLKEVYAQQIPLNIYLGDGTYRVPKDFVTDMYNCAVYYPNQSLKFDGSSLDRIDVDGDGTFDVEMVPDGDDLLLKKLNTASAFDPVTLSLPGLKYAPILWNPDETEPVTTTTTTSTTTTTTTTTKATTTKATTTTTKATTTTTEAATTTTTATAEPETPLKGDYNQDNTVTVADAVLLARFTAEDSALTNNQISRILDAAPDYDGDGLVTVLDLTALLIKLITT